MDFDVNYSRQTGNRGGASAVELSCRYLSHRAFTLVELLVTIAIVAILSSLLLSGINGAMRSAKKVRCQTQMKQWGVGMILYLEDWEGKIPDVMDRTVPYIIDGNVPATTETYRKLRFCPASRRGAPPFSNRAERFEKTEFNCRITDVYGENNSDSLTALFTTWSRTQEFRPVSSSRVRRVSDGLLFLDGFTRVASLAERRWRPVHDMDGNGKRDTSANHFALGVPFNSARPTVHGGGANAGLLDGHVEWVRYEALWDIESDRKPSHRFWHFK